MKRDNPQDYCSMCGQYKSQMKNHRRAHFLIVRDELLEAREYF